jgi:uncharacterized protein (TIGR03067 family)
MVDNRESETHRGVNLMRTHLAIVVAAVLLIAADTPNADAVKADLAKMQGTWRLESGEYNGKRMPELMIKNVTRTITGDKFEVSRGGKPAGKGTMMVDPTKSPKTVDAEVIEAGEENKKPAKALGIYELDGDTMRTCLAEPGKDRPTEFSTKPGNGHRVFVWKRMKK